MIEPEEPNEKFVKRVRRQVQTMSLDTLDQYGDISNALYKFLKEYYLSKGIVEEEKNLGAIREFADALAKDTNPDIDVIHAANNLFYVGLAILEDPNSYLPLFLNDGQNALSKFLLDPDNQNAPSSEYLNSVAKEIQKRVKKLANNSPIRHEKLFVPCNDFDDFDSTLFLVWDHGIDRLMPNFAITAKDGVYINPLKKQLGGWEQKLEEIWNKVNQQKNQIIGHGQGIEALPTRGEFKAVACEMYHWFDKNHEVGKFYRGIIQEVLKTLNLGPVQESARYSPSK